MKRFLQNLASSVLRPEPNLHPFAESIYPTAPWRAAGDRIAQAPEIVIARSRPRAAGTPVASPASGQTFMPSPQPPIPRSSNRPSSSIPEENVSGQEPSHYQPLLPMREMQSCFATGAFPSLHRDAGATATSTADSHYQRRQDEERDTNVASKTVISGAPAGPDELRPVMHPQPLRPPFEAEMVPALRKPPLQAPQFVARPQPETRAADDIQINIGRIEVIAVPQSAPRTTPMPTRKGMSLDEYLSRRNGRAG